MKERLLSELNVPNTAENFDINCRKTVETSTRIQVHGCFPEFFDQAISQNTQDAALFTFLSTQDLLLPPRYIAQLEKENYGKLGLLIIDIENKNEGFKNSLIELQKAEREYIEKNNV